MRLLLLLLPLCLIFPAINGCSRMETNPAEPPAPALSITSPAAGDVLSAGSTFAIVWESTGLADDPVRIDLRNDSGLVLTIAGAVPNTGTWTWSLPLQIPGSARYRVTITAGSVDQVYGTSDFFTIVNHNDPYEPDSSYSRATNIDTGGTPQQHTLGRNDVDWFRFNGVSGATYCIQTFGTTDTYLCLYSAQAPDSLFLLASDNDAGIGPNALIAWTCVSPAVFYFTVSGNTRSNSLPYSVSLSAGGAVFMITYPAPGSSFTGGHASSVEWARSSNSGAAVSLHLYRNDTLSRIITHGSPNNGYFSWTVPATVPSSSRYRIKIMSDSDTSIGNFGDYFTITNAPWSVAVDFPSAFSAWSTGSSYNICWTVDGNPDSIASISLYNDSTRIMTVADSVPVADNCFRWTVPGTLPTSSRYRIKITGITDTIVSGFSERFSIVNIPPGLTIVSPVAAQWRAGTIDTIRWVATGSPGPFARLQLFDGESPVIIIAANVNLAESNGLYRWPIPANLPTSTEYRVKITGSADTALFDFSDPFTITGIPAAIAVTAPEESSVWHAGSPCAVAWTSAGPVGDTLRIGLYRDSLLVQPLISTPLGSGSFPFYLAPALEGGNRYRIKIQSAALPSVAGYSGWFTVVPIPLNVSVTSPAQDSSWTTGGAYSITWSFSGPPGAPVKIDLYDSSIFVRTISAQESGSNRSYQWIVPLALQTSDRYRIKISSTSVDTVFDFSDPFAITHQDASLGLTAPAAGASWNAGTTHTITWNSSANVPGNFVTIDLYDSTAFVAAISSGAGRAAGAYSWALPASVRGGARYRIKIASVADSTVYAFSGEFTIVQQPNTLTLTAPSAGVSWSAGGYYTIYWSYTGAPGPSVKLDLYDSSAFIRSISSGAYTAGTSFLWLVPSSLLPSNAYRIKIQSAALDTVLDFSDYFSITNSVVNDAFEPDGDFSIARPIEAGSPAQNRILTMNDHDWFSMTAVAGVTYTIETRGATDTYLDLFSTDGTTLLASDDDSGSQLLNAKIVWTPVTGGVYFFRIQGSAGATGSYSVTVQ